MTADPARWALAGVLAILWLLLSGWWLRPAKRVGVSADATLILYASQTGQALELAQMTLRRLLEGGQNAVMMPLGQAEFAQMAACEQLLVIASTTGLGQPPDDAARFVARVEETVPDMTSTRYAVLALGDRRYEHFCAFGRQLDSWLEQAGAKRLHALVEVDDLAREALAQWDRLLDALGGVETTAPSETLHRPWRIVARDHLNPAPEDVPGVSGLFRIMLEPEDGALPDWQAGDLFEITTPTGHRRDYSVASLPDEGRVTLLVREVVDADGRRGEGSGLLVEATPVEGTVSGRLRDHAPFHAPAGDGPLLLIAAGSGFAGIRPHAIEAMWAGRRLWIILGERRPDIDARITSEAQAWDREGRLVRLDLAYSRLGEGRGRYVQHVVTSEAEAVARYLGQEGAIMLCGGLAMGKEVEAAVEQALGAAWVAAARAAGRYHADLY
ncbi:MAG TPA: NADPH cytochrome P450 oxidoreductase family protein [Sphingobium sp.]|uniref:NADPH cytochrome P450 oxidoreductase family protein n=1 Tax=Sphingobium sp. TaxID=1912891 RepID=UPI002ED5F966